MPPDWSQWTDLARLAEALTRPWRFAAEELAPVGGLSMLSSVFALGTILYVWWHAKDAFPAGVAGVALGLVMLVLPEVRLAAYAALGVGAALIVWRVMRRVV